MDSAPATTGGGGASHAVNRRHRTEAERNRNQKCSAFSQPKQVGRLDQDGEEAAEVEVRPSLVNMGRSFFDQSCNLLRPGDVDRMACARDFDFVAFGPRGIPPFEIGIDGSITSSHHHPARFAPPCGRRDDCVEVLSEIKDLGTGHEIGLRGGQIGSKVLMELRGIQVSETVGRFLDHGGLAEIAWESLSVLSLALSRVRHVGRDVYQADNNRVGSCLCDYGAAVAVSNQDAGSILKSKNPLRGGHVVFKRSLRLLDDADVIAVFDKDVVNSLPP